MALVPEAILEKLEPIERLQLRHEMTSRLLPYGKNARSES